MKFSITATPGNPLFASILWRGPATEACRLASELGYEGVEWHLRRVEDVDEELLVELMSASGLEVPTLGTGLAAGQDGLSFADPDARVRQEAVARVQGHIRLAGRLGAAVTIGLIWGRVGQNPSARAQREDFALHCLRACCEAGQAQGVTVLLEPLNRYESDYPRTLAEGCQIISQVGAPNLKLLADTFHMNIEEVDLAASLCQSAPWLGHVHLADTNRRAPGHGHLDIASVMSVLQQIGYQGHISFEVLPLPSARQAAEDALRAAKNAIRRKESPHDDR